MKRITTLTVFLVLAIALNASAFDGKRKGFVIGGGLGVAPAVKWEGPVNVYDLSGTYLGTETVDETRAGVGVSILLGYAWDESNMIVLDGNAAAMQSKIFIGEPTVSQGYGGISWYHYFGETGHSYFTVVGLGSYSFQIEDEHPDDRAEEKAGLLLGGGYEFSPHWQVGAYLSFGETKDAVGTNKHSTLNVLVSAVAF